MLVQKAVTPRAAEENLHEPTLLLIDRREALSWAIYREVVTAEPGGWQARGKKVVERQE